MNTPASGKATPLAALGERAIVALIRARFPADPSVLPVGIGDDAAVAVPPRGQLEVLTTDALVEDVHFQRGYSTLEDAGFKAVAVNVSDVASMGARPRLALVSLMLPDGLTLGDLEALLDGVAAMAREAGIAIAGGNITRSPGPLIVDVTVTGAVGRRKFLRRSGGRPGDALYLTGSVGAAAAGLGWLRSRDGTPLDTPQDPGLADCVSRYRRPEPRWRLGATLGRTRAASACMDLSDGLADAVTQVAEASGTGAIIDADRLPIPAAASSWFSANGQDPIRAAVAGGDDYELLFAVPPRHRGRLKLVSRQARGVPMTRIGELTASKEIVLMRNGAPEPLPQGYVHFSV